ncbi:uncharacterized protein LOC106012020 [Aplysia californica]|uniref:Uncharacterized protein LOC106012020 n=1 Tax=Aplysia californica TaxID=6500 RepID=A0ABM1A1R5_APLCA|nr:uncharacterized protein LOC106012020 [Aplysia californica]
MNFSGRWISLIQAAVLQESYYYAQGKEIIFRQYLNTHDDVFDTGFRTGRRWHEIKLLVPPYLADSGLETCKIMRVKYFFQFKVQLEKKEDIMVETPLYIGHHPDEMVEDGKDLLLGRMWQGITSLPQESPRQEFPWLDPTEQQQQLQAQAQDFPLDNYYR